MKKIKYNYQDSAENFLLKFFDKPQSQKQMEIDKLLNNNPPWPVLYHLHPQREFILDWFPFKKNASLLEIGAGCGAVTNVFIRKLKTVIANELTKERAKIIKKRFADKKNLKVYDGNINENSFNKKFDYVTLIGVLEYQGRYTLTKKSHPYSPYIQFLKNLKKFLKKSSTLIIAIENKIGVKYIAGGLEDHYGKLFYSLENYPNDTGIRTFSKEEIKEILNLAGYKKIDFYYPYPDYKLPFFIFSDDKENLFIPTSRYTPIVDLSNLRQYLFNEVIFSSVLKKEGVLKKFANSFLIFAQL
mgnify:FL=1